MFPAKSLVSKMFIYEFMSKFWESTHLFASKFLVRPGFSSPWRGPRKWPWSEAGAPTEKSLYVFGFAALVWFSSMRSGNMCSELIIHGPARWLRDEGAVRACASSPAAGLRRSGVRRAVDDTPSASTSARARRFIQHSRRAAPVPTAAAYGIVRRIIIFCYNMLPAPRSRPKAL